MARGVNQQKVPETEKTELLISFPLPGFFQEEYLGRRVEFAKKSVCFLKRRCVSLGWWRIRLQGETGHAIQAGGGCGRDSAWCLWNGYVCG